MTLTNWTILAAAGSNGAAGAAGPAGAQGPQGLAGLSIVGPSGPTGPAGTNGISLGYWSGTTANAGIANVPTQILPTSSGQGSGLFYQNMPIGSYLATANVTASISGVFGITYVTPLVQCAILINNGGTIYIPTLSQATFPPANNAQNSTYANLSVMAGYQITSPSNSVVLDCQNEASVGSMNAAFATLSIVQLNTLQVQ